MSDISTPIVLIGILIVTIVVDIYFSEYIIGNRGYTPKIILFLKLCKNKIIIFIKKLK
jgi:hypothetical protein